jgi:hypothetical protein
LAKLGNSENNLCVCKREDKIDMAFKTGGYEMWFIWLRTGTRGELLWAGHEQDARYFLSHCATIN